MNDFQDIEYGFLLYTSLLCCLLVLVLADLEMHGNGKTFDISNVLDFDYQEIRLLACYPTI